MLTLTEHPDNVKLGVLVDGTTRKPIFFHPKKNPDLRLEVDDVSTYNTQEFRDRFSLTRVQAGLVMDHIKKNTEPEGGLQKIFFKVKNFVNDALYTEMDLRSSTQTIEVNFPDGNDTWPELSIVCGASNSGKTYFIASKIERNLNGKKKHRRKFFWVSAEFHKDKTLKRLKKDKYRYNFSGVDIGEQAFAMAHESREEFFKNKVKNVIEQLEPGSVVIMDDPMDSAIAKQLRPYIATLLRTARHDAIGLMYIVHSIRSGSWSSQAHNSVKYFVLFPRHQRGKIRNYLNQEVGLTLKEARENVADFGDAGRVLQVRIHAPQCLISEKLIRLI